MDQMKLQRIIISMKENNVPQLIVADPASICYLTGRMLNCGERMLALYLDVEGNHKFFIGKLFPQSTPIEGAEIVYFDDTDDYVGMLADVMRENTVVGIDKVWPAKFLLSLMNKLNATKFIDGSFIIDNIRQIKDEKEQELMRIASKINDTAMEKLMPLVKEGYTELEMADKLFEMYAEMDAPEFSFDPIIGYGVNAADPHHESDNSKGKIGDSVVLDIGCVKDGYCSDMTRTVFIGEVSEKGKEVYEIVKEANLRGIAACKPGNRFCDVDNACRDYITEKGYGEYFTHRTGHSIGMECHEFGDVSSVNENILKPGMIFSVEPSIYLPGDIGVRIEDLVLITEDGCEVLNNVTKDLIVIK